MQPRFPPPYGFVPPTGQPQPQHPLGFLPPRVGGPMHHLPPPPGPGVFMQNPHMNPLAGGVPSMIPGHPPRMMMMPQPGLTYNPNQPHPMPMMQHHHMMPPPMNHMIPGQVIVGKN